MSRTNRALQVTEEIIRKELPAHLGEGFHISHIESTFIRRKKRDVNYMTVYLEPGHPPLDNAAIMEFDIGLFWGAAAQLLRTVIDTDATLEFTGHDSYRQAAQRVEQLSTESFDVSDYDAANRLHIHFYQGQLTGKDLKYVRRITKRLIRRLNAYLAQPADGE